MPDNPRLSSASFATTPADAAAMVQQLERHLVANPDDTDSLISLSAARFASGQFRASIPPLLHAAAHLPRNAPIILRLVQRLIACGEVVAARACLDLLAHAPDPPAELLAAQAHLRFTLGEVPVALELLDHAMAAGLDTPEAHHMHAMLLQFAGDMAGAERALHHALARWPGFGDAATVLVNLRRQTIQTQRLDAWREQLRQQPADDTPDRMFVRAEFEHACFKTLDDLDRPDEAWPALARCNALMHRLNPYPADAEAAAIDALCGLQPQPGAHAPRPEGPSPIFIVGMPRSGTTLLDRILSSHPMVSSAGELVDFWRQLHRAADVTPRKALGLVEIVRRHAAIDYAQLGARYLRETQWRAHGKPWYVDKLPANIQLVAFIRHALPHAPILHMVRDPMDTCWSNFKALFGNISPYSYSFDALAHCFLGYQRLVRHWHQAMPDAMLDVSYADLVQAPEPTIRRILDYCGLPPDPACLHPERNAQPVATPSSAQVREAMHTRSLGQWRRYAAQLEPLRTALGAGIP